MVQLTLNIVESSLLVVHCVKEYSWTCQRIKFTSTSINVVVEHPGEVRINKRKYEGGTIIHRKLNILEGSFEKQGGKFRENRRPVNNEY